MDGDICNDWRRDDSRAPPQVKQRTDTNEPISKNGFPQDNRHKQHSQGNIYPLL
jgi:hypothetical protein